MDTERYYFVLGEKEEGTDITLYMKYITCILNEERL